MSPIELSWTAKNEGDDNEQVDGDNNVVPAQLRGCVQWTARELTHHCSHGTRCERTAEGEILKSGNGKVGNESIPCGFSNLYCTRKKYFRLINLFLRIPTFVLIAIFGKGNNLKTLKQ